VQRFQIDAHDASLVIPVLDLAGRGRVESERRAAADASWDAIVNPHSFCRVRLYRRRCDADHTNANERMPMRAHDRSLSPGTPMIEYVLPLRWRDDRELADLTAYLALLRRWADVTVVDGSDRERFAAHAAAWAGLVRHLRVDGDQGRNGKVRGVLTGIGVARHEQIVIADDDVRYDRASLDAVVSDLAFASLVKPQNHFTPLPWHARWDTGRSLLNRAIASDYPGTYAVRRSAMRRIGDYDADVLFENLELERTIRASGGVVSDRPDIYVARRPPTLRHFLSQRVRQAYDSFAQPR